MSKFNIPKNHHYFHFNKRLRERYGLSITVSEYFELCNQIDQSGDTYLLEDDRFNQNYFYIPFMGQNLIVVFDRAKKLLITTYSNCSTPDQIMNLTLSPFLANLIYSQNITNLFFLDSNIEFQSGFLLNLQKQQDSSTNATMFIIRRKKVFLYEMKEKDKKNILTSVKGSFHTNLPKEELINLHPDTKITQIYFSLQGKFQEY